MARMIACRHCDTLVEYPTLSHAESAYCPVCNYRISIRPKYSLQFTLSFSISCMFLLFITNVFPFISINANGNSQTMYFIESSFAFFEQGQWLLSIFVFMSLFVFPLIIILGLIYILYPMIFMRKVAPGTHFLARIIFKMKSWNMIDVYLIAILASLTKLMSLAQVEFGYGLWAYMTFSVFLAAALGNLDKIRFWHYLDKILCHQKLKQQPNKI
ncbi:paraquat-inducible protein A [Catenovulum maritimum]|uniref:Paraquat-inducible protein A n=1 Tax=Catenovulum maritimum TaxID=1513271 RepID=A0A0J8JHM1_9ALTE|nr:paraquat-inducible protein A [Catenovulum maritimum]KMT63936.1 hypothetical protein XM47_17060 [Catenovulum maritimum]